MNAIRALACVLLLLGCSGATETDAGPGGSDAGGMDGGAVSDAGSSDAGSSDAGSSDAGSSDAGSSDAGSSDAGMPRDAGGRSPMNHRADDSECRAAAPAGSCSFEGGACSTDADCTDGVNGRCNMNLGGAAFCRCTYDTCADDSECSTGETCACHGATFHADSNECLPGNCRVDSDCGAGGFCSPTIGGCGGLAGYYCHTADDRCTDDADCAGGGLMACQYASTTARWECMARLFCP